MTEKEKAYAGLLYDFVGDPELQEAYFNAKNKCFEFNNIHPKLKQICLSGNNR
jgi:Maltose acetyltransferase.